MNQKIEKEIDGLKNLYRSSQNLLRSDRKFLVIDEEDMKKEIRRIARLAYEEGNKDERNKFIGGASDEDLKLLLKAIKEEQEKRIEEGIDNY